MSTDDKRMTREEFEFEDLFEELENELSTLTTTQYLLDMNELGSGTYEEILGELVQDWRNYGAVLRKLVALERMPWPEPKHNSVV